MHGFSIMQQCIILPLSEHGKNAYLIAYILTFNDPMEPELTWTDLDPHTKFVLLHITTLAPPGRGIPTALLICKVPCVALRIASRNEDLLSSQLFMICYHRASFLKTVISNNSSQSQRETQQEDIWRIGSFFLMRPAIRLPDSSWLTLPIPVTKAHLGLPTHRCRIHM